MNAQNSLREVISTAVQLCIPMPVFIAALAFFDGYRSDAQRDYFGAHCYQLLSNPGIALHINWTGKGRRVTLYFRNYV
ncbi:unnamed protein product [Meloidogyne enterolobii]|uniref:Uncharacterized protein n=2 Tax=Meloidogyne enterolobii TaxID=390850 RepID=A0ACB1AF87_MELEN|nr:unnamed protein product [Meloidogyne enterolobii]